MPCTLEVPIEIIGHPIGSLSTGTLDPTRTAAGITSTDYDGSPTCYFDVVVINTDATAKDIILRAGGNTLSTISVPSGTSVPTRFRSISFSLAAGFNLYNIRLPQTTSDNQFKVLKAHFVIQQTNATKTRIQIPLAAKSHTTVEPDSSQLTSHFNGSGWVSNLHERIWKLELSKFSQITAGGAFQLECYLNVTGGTYGKACLYNITQSQPVTGSVITVSNPTTPWTRCYSVFPATAQYLTDGDDFKFAITGDGASGTTKIAAPRLYITLINLWKAQLILSMSGETTSSTTSENLNGQRTFVDTTKFDSPTFYFEGTLIGGDNANLVFLKNDGVNDSGTAGSDVVGASLNPNASVNPIRVRSAALTISSARHWVRKAASTAAMNIVGTWLITEVVGTEPVGGFLTRNFRWNRDQIGGLNGTT